MDPTTEPKETMLFLFNPGKLVYAGSIVFKDAPGSLATAAAALAKAGINIVASEQARMEGAKTASWGFFAESDLPIDVDKTIALVRATGAVVSVRLSEGADGIVVDQGHYPLKYSSGHQAMAFRRENVVDMFERMKKVFGTGANVILYELGVASGESDARALEASVGKDLTMALLVDLGFLYAAEGWGLPDVQELSLDPFKATTRFHDCFECAHQKSSSPNSQYLRGHLVGLAGTLLGKKFTCEETKCLFMGDEYCEFVMKEVAEPGRLGKPAGPRSR